MKAASRRRIITAFIVAFITCQVTGCAILPPEKVEVKKEVLNSIPALPHRKPSATIVLVFPPESDPVYDTTQMAYTKIPFQIAYFSEHEWAETPAHMLQSLLIRTLEKSHYFNAVITPPYAGHYTFAVRTQLFELLQDFTASPAELRLSLYCQLIDGATGQIRAAKEISIHQPMQKNNPEAGVAAANYAVAMALQNIVEFVFAHER
jgi:cholesterol transport system auxiliary component